MKKCIFVTRFLGVHCGWCMVLASEKKLFSCLFFVDVLCSFRTSVKFYIMERCFECVHYKRFLKEEQDEEEEFFEEVNKIRKFDYPKKFDVPKGGS